MEAKTGTLYLCATPIGNLKDITERVLETLGAVDLIAAEDTRNTLRLLNHYGIRKPLTSYHEHNKYEKARELIDRHLLQGEDIALVTDAGTPVISDPGEVIARECIEQGIRVTSLPGACALITALTMSGMDARRFCFEGFLPPDKKERAHVLLRLAGEERTTIFYEAPHHLKGTLQERRPCPRRSRAPWTTTGRMSPGGSMSWSLRGRTLQRSPGKRRRSGRPCRFRSTWRSMRSRACPGRTP